MAGRQDDESREYYEKLRSHDPDAWRKFVEEYTVLLMGFIRNLLWCSWDLAEDITQQVFVAVLENLSKLKNPDRFRGWVFMIARFTAYRELRNDNLERHFVKLEDWDGSNAVLEPWEYMNAEELELKLTKNLDILTDAQREIFELYFYQNLSNSAIALKLGKKVNLVNVQLFKIRRRLREAFEQEQA